MAATAAVVVVDSSAAAALAPEAAAVDAFVLEPLEVTLVAFAALDVPSVEGGSEGGEGQAQHCCDGGGASSACNLRKEEMLLL